jgi:hypothetical protein
MILPVHGLAFQPVQTKRNIAGLAESEGGGEKTQHDVLPGIGNAAVRLAR